MSLIMSPEGQPGGVVSVLIDRVISRHLICKKVLTLIQFGVTRQHLVTTLPSPGKHFLERAG